MKADKQILVMDDDPQGGAALSELIRNYGFQVECVESIQSARKRIQEQTYDGLVIDMWMKDGAGRDLLTWLRQNGHMEPVVAVSDTADYDQWIDLVNNGAADLLAKPVAPSQLKRALQLAMGDIVVNERSWQQVSV